jgi:serine/threonine-protein kinase RsbW
VDADRVRIEIVDEGEGFDPAIVPDCTLEDRLEVPSGRGVMLIRSFMTRVAYNAKGNAVVLEKVRASTDA